MSFLDNVGDFLSRNAGNINLAAAGLSTAASLYSGYSQYRASREQSKLIKRQAESDARMKRLETRRQIGAQRASLAAAGIKVDDGTAQLLIDETEQLGMQEADDIIRYGRQQAKSYRREGRGAAIGSALSGGAQLLNGFARNSLLKEQYPELFR